MADDKRLRKKKKIMKDEIKEKVMAEDKSHRSNTITEELEDRISQLPDCLLLHILSFLYSDEAARTCLLSKRWQFIWTGILKVDFRKFRSKDKKIQSWDWVGKMLAMCNCLKKLYVRLEYGDFLPSDVDHWIQLAIKNKVRSITLDLIYPLSGKPKVEIYKLPEELYSYSSLTKLRLVNCMLAPQGIITWGSLVKLRVENVDLSADFLMEKISTSLNNLNIHSPNLSLNNLNIYSPNLTTLEILGCKDQIPIISAPLLRILVIDNLGLNPKAYREEFNNEESDEELDEESDEEFNNEESDEEFDEESDEEFNNEESDEEFDEESDEEFNNEESDEEFDEESNEEIYEHTEEFYSYSSLTKLTLCKCVLAPQGILMWGCLKSLTVEDAKLSDSLMEKILSSCPVLEFLRLVICSGGLNNLNICSQNLTTLEIVGFESNELPNISAPHLRILLIENHDCEELFMLKNLSSIVEVTLGTMFKLSTSIEITLMNHMKQILQSLKSAKTIEFSNPVYLTVFSSLEVEGWKFPLFIQLRCLKLEALTHEMSTIPGILALLRSSPNLEALEIDMDQHEQDISLEEDGVSLHNYDYDTDIVASHLKTVKINLFDGLDFFKETFFSILLKSAQVLEEMTIKVESNQHESNKIVERLLTLPKASSKAVIVPCS